MGTFQEEGEQLKLSNPNGNEFMNLTAITPAPALAGTEWKLQSFNDGQGAVVKVLAGSEITAQFGTDGTLSGSAGCNNYSATYEVSGDTLTIGATISTEKACLEPEGIMEQETQYLAALQQSTIVRNLVAGLILLDADEKPTTTYLVNK
jgi:heat shock protein HslJ